MQGQHFPCGASELAGQTGAAAERGQGAPAGLLGLLCPPSPHTFRCLPPPLRGEWNPGGQVFAGFRQGPAHRWPWHVKPRVKRCLLGPLLGRCGVPAGWKEPRAVAPAPIPRSRGRLRSSHSWACKRHIPVPGSGRAPVTQPSLTARRRRPPWSCPLVPPPTGPRGSPLSSEGGKPGPQSASEAFQTLPGPLVINENLNILFPGWSQGFE